jgi:hypothetical protein
MSLLRCMPFISSFYSAVSEKRARYRAGIGIGISVLLHVLFFGIIAFTINNKKVESPVQGDLAPLEVSFITRPAPKPVPAAAPAPKTPAPKPKQTKPKQAQPRVTPPKPSVPVQEVAHEGTIPKLPPEMDMSSMLNAARARRHAAESQAAEENAAARAAEGPKSANDIAKANIAFQMNKKSGGQNGVFQILTKGPRVASYAFNGWTNDSRFSERQVFQVDAGAGGDVELAIVNSMIALIRKYYKEDFNWDSQRLGRVVILSARPADNAGLQTFLIQEFFGVTRR